MDLKEIKHLLQQYFDGQSTEKDEKVLHDYFSSGIVAEELKKYSEFFWGLNELSEQRDEQFEEEIMDYILENEFQEKTRYRWLWQTVTGVAAALLVALLAINFNQSRYEWEDTYTDPNIAYAEASKTLQYVAGKYQKGIAQLSPIQKVNEAKKPLNNGLNILQKGFQEVQSFEKINEKLKK